ncbi:MAG: hypothetical protein NTV42_08775 [Chloroflexi bacterium]|nr:hypothetical protein [Chloroflexota bacterium]
MTLHIRLYRAIAYFALASMLASTACAGLFNPQPSISEVTLTTGFVSDYRPADTTVTFYVDSPRVCCSARVSGAVPSTTVKASWTSLKGGMSKEAKPVIREDTAVCDKDCYVGFTLPAPEDGFINGDYQVDLSISGAPKASGTFSILKDPSVPIPGINSFTADPPRITAGQEAVLKWKVTGASRVNIQPIPGTVAVEGGQAVNPAVDTTYTLYAVNRGGCSYSALTVNVAPFIKEKPDLQILEFWSSGNVISYRIKNAGDLASCPTMTYLYKNDLLESKDYVAPLAPGEERVEALQQYHFSPKFGYTGGSEATTDAVNIRICANAEAACVESNAANNCLEHNFGPLLSINLARYAHTAHWQSGDTTLNWPILKDSNTGLAYISTAQLGNGESYQDALLVAPPPAGGWIQGTFGLLRGTPETLEPFYIPHKCKFTCKLGLTRDTRAPAGAKFMLGTMQGNEITYFPPVTIDSTSKIEAYEVDLSQFAGKKVYFIFRVESGGPWQQGSTAWIEPIITQET